MLGNVCIWIIIGFILMGIEKNETLSIKNMQDPIVQEVNINDLVERDYKIGIQVQESSILTAYISRLNKTEEIELLLVNYTENKIEQVDTYNGQGKISYEIKNDSIYNILALKKEKKEYIELNSFIEGTRYDIDGEK